jgi:uncharacterized protein (DUF433 family)
LIQRFEVQNIAERHPESKCLSKSASFPGFELKQIIVYLSVMNPLLQRISANPNIAFGKPCIKGTRIWVSLILDFLAAGDSVETILENYPQLTREDVLACIAYGSAMSRHCYVEIDHKAA